LIGYVDTDWKPRRNSSPLDSWSPAAPGELSTQSEEFRTRSAAHNVRLHQTGAKHVHHPVVGDLSLTFEMLELRADPGLTILTYTAEPGSKSEEALNLLGELGSDARSGGAVKGGADLLLDTREVDEDVPPEPVEQVRDRWHAQLAYLLEYACSSMSCH
jgi:MmyB-like transcription regulator ligand binding domain